MGDCLSSFADLREVEVGNTRENRAIDRIFLNVSRSVVEAGMLEPLETEGAGEDLRRSDHRIAFCKILLERRQSFKWIEYSYRHFNDDSVEQFRSWVVMHDWAEVLSSETTDIKAEEYQRMVVGAVERFFPLRTVKRKSSDPPWMNKKVAKMIEDRKKLFIEEVGRMAVWKAEKKRMNEEIRKRKRGFLDNQKESLLREDAARHFYRNVCNFGAAERPKLFDVRDLMPEGQSDAASTDQLADYFNRISNEFEPLRPGEIPFTRDKELPVLHEYKVAARIRKFRKPK